MPQYVYLEKTPESGIYRNRGVPGENDDFDSFAKKMAGGNNNLRAFLADEHLGREIKITEGEDGPVTEVLEV